jgi:hypothetical protein
MDMMQFIILPTSLEAFRFLSNSNCHTVEVIVVQKVELHKKGEFLKTPFLCHFTKKYNDLLL